MALSTNGFNADFRSGQTTGSSYGTPSIQAVTLGS